VKKKAQLLNPSHPPPPWNFFHTYVRSTQGRPSVVVMLDGKEGTTKAWCRELERRCREVHGGSVVGFGLWGVVVLVGRGGFGRRGGKEDLASWCREVVVRCWGVMGK